MSAFHRDRGVADDRWPVLRGRLVSVTLLATQMHEHCQVGDLAGRSLMSASAVTWAHAFAPIEERTAPGRCAVEETSSRSLRSMWMIVPAGGRWVSIAMPKALVTRAAVDEESIDDHFTTRRDRVAPCRPSPGWPRSACWGH